jgi:hypothetical protein
MADIYELCQEFLDGNEELEAIADLLKIDNTIRRRQAREGSAIDLETLVGNAWLMYLRYFL